MMPIYLFAEAEPLVSGVSGADNEWLEVNIIGDRWPRIKEPSLMLSHEFVFSPNEHILPNSFYMMVQEVSCKQFLLEKTLSRFRQSDVNALCEYGMNEPVTGISFFEALTFCQEKGGDLPSERQWVYVASLIKKAWLKDYGVVSERAIKAKKAFSGFKEDITDTITGPYTFQGLYGSVWEMTKTEWKNEKGKFVIKGGSFDLTNKPWLMHPYYRAAFNQNDIYNQNIGFRCVK